jgi:hypothetical protein
MTQILQGQQSTGGDDSRQKDHLEIEKLRLETEKLRRDATWKGRLAAVMVPMSVSMITAVVAVVGIGISVWTLIQQGKDRSDEAHDKSLQQALSMATDNRASDRRVSGVYQLREFWRYERNEQVVAATLAALLVLPDNVLSASSVRCAAAEAIGSAYGKPKAAALLAEDTTVRRIRGLLYGSSEGRWSLAGC